MSCLGCQHFISDWLGKRKPNKLSTGCQNELKGAAVEKATNPGRRFLFFSRLRRSFSRASRANFEATPLLCPARQNRHATQATKPQKNGKESYQKRQVEQRKHYLSLARKSFKNRENIKRKRETGNIRRKRELIPAKTTGELKSLSNSAHGLICLERKENQYYTDCTYSC